MINASLSRCRSEFRYLGAVVKLLFCGFLALQVSACGMKGNLYMPEDKPVEKQAAAGGSYVTTNQLTAVEPSGRRN